MRGPYYVIPKGGAFSFIEKGLKGIAREVVPGFSTAESIARSLGPKPKRQGAVLQGPTVQTPGGTIATLGSIKLPGGLGLTLPGFGKPAGIPEGSCPPGYHLDKATRTRCVRNRQTNYANGRAAARSARRLKGTIKQLSSIAAAVGKKVVRTGSSQPRRKK